MAAIRLRKFIRISTELTNEHLQVKRVAEAFRTTERDELEAELARRLLELKKSAPADIRNWESCTAKFLYNKAANWIRDYRANDARKADLADFGEDYLTTLEDILPFAEIDMDFEIAFARVWKELHPDLRLLWEVLLEERGNQAKSARRLGKHRNTVRLWVHKIKQILKRHGFQETNALTTAK
jgi:hypothetical protein